MVKLLIYFKMILLTTILEILKSILVFLRLKKLRKIFSDILIGLNENWTDWSATTEGIFTNLYEGDYIFEVQALDANFNESEIESYLFLSVLLGTDHF